MYNGKVILKQGLKLSDQDAQDKAIIFCAIRCATRHDEWARNPSAWENKKNRSPRPDPRITR